MVRPLLATSLLVLAGCFAEIVDIDTDGVEPTTSTSTGLTGATTTGSGTSGTGPSSTAAGEDSGSTGPAATTIGEDSTSGSGSSGPGDTSTGSSTGGLPSVCPALLDTFDDGIEDPLWIQTNPGSTFEEGGESIINITPPADDEFARMMVAPGDFAGSTMRIEIGTPPAADGVFMILWLEQSDGEGRIAYNLVQHGNDLRLEARITTEAGPPGSILEETDWNPTTQQWLQLREEAGTMHFESSQDGAAFDPVFEMPTPIGVGDVRVGFVGHNNVELDAPAQVSVRTFELLCG